MGCVLAIIRSGAALVLGVIIFSGFLCLLLLNNCSEKLLSAEFYINTVNEEDTYNRIYDDVLLDRELVNTTQELLGGVQVVSHEEIVGLLREIIPPEYLQSEIGSAIQRTVDYFNKDRLTLDLHVNIGPPLDNIKPVIFRYIDYRIDALPEEDLGRLECTPAQVNEVANLYQDRLSRLSDGKMPTSIPTLTSFEPGCRLLIFELAFDNLVAQFDLSASAKHGLSSRNAELREHFVAGEAKEVLKVAARPLAEPMMDDAIEKVREELDGKDRLDMIHTIAMWNGDFTEDALRSEIDTVRDWVNWGQKVGRLVAWLMLILGSLLLGVIHYPSMKNMLMWPGVCLFLIGLVFLITGKVMESQVPDRLRDLVERGATEATNVPPSVTELGGDLLGSFGQQLASGFAGPGLILLVIGALIFGASFFFVYVMLLTRLILSRSRLVLSALNLSGSPSIPRSAVPPDNSAIGEREYPDS